MHSGRREANRRPLTTSGFAGTASCARLHSHVPGESAAHFRDPHVGELDDYLRVFEYLESARNFFYRNYSTPDHPPVGDKETLKEDLRDRSRRWRR